MGALEIVLLICGGIFITVSFIMSPGEKPEEGETPEAAELNENQLNHIRDQIDEVVAAQLETVSEQTEAQLDKLSAAKVLELNEFADTVLGEINRNHNETMFLYDMLNEKAKELKNTVKDVNIAKQQVEKLQEEAAAAAELLPKEPQSEVKEEKPKAKRGRKPAEKKEAPEKNTGESLTPSEAPVQEEAAPKKRGRKKKAEEAPAATENEEAAALTDAKTAVKETETQKEPAQEATALDKTQLILNMSKDGKEIKDIARELEIGIGEVNLILGLYK